MKVVFWTPEAESRLEDIEAYIAKDSPAAAKEVIARQLETAPLSGHEIPEYREKKLRELLERPYRIIYRVTEERIEILTVMHYRQLLPRKASALQKPG